MTLSDTGPIVALLNRNDANHNRCTALLPGLAAPLVTTQACITEAMYLIGRDTGYAGQSALWNMIGSGAIIITDTDDDVMVRARTLMKQYKDMPCDYADAVLVAVAERLKTNRVFTLDSHFYAYRLENGNALDVVS